MANTIGELVVRLGFDPSGLDRGATRLESRLEQTGTRLYFLGSRIAAAFSAPLAAVTGAITKFGLEFDGAMTESLAIMDQVTPALRARMEAQARAISETTKFTSVEAAKAYYDLASAGLDAANAVESLPVVAKFAQAGMFDLAQATTYLTGAQAALGKNTGTVQENMEAMARIANVLTEINNKALGKVEDFASALSNRAGAALRLYNKDVEEGVAVLGVYAQQNIRGAAAGNQLFMAMRDLTTAAVKYPDHFKQAGIAVFDTSGKMRNMADIVSDLERRFANLSDAGKRQEIMYLGLTSRSQGALMPLIGMSDKIRELESDLRKAGNTTDEVAHKQMQSLTNRLIVLKNEFVNAGQRIFTAFVPVINEYIIPGLRHLVNVGKDVASWFESLSTHSKLVVATFTALGIALGPVIIAVGGFLLSIRSIFAPITMATSAMAALTKSYQAHAIAALEAAGAERALATSLTSSMSVQELMRVADSGRYAKTLAKDIQAVKEEVKSAAPVMQTMATATSGWSMTMQKASTTGGELKATMSEVAAAATTTAAATTAATAETGLFSTAMATLGSVAEWIATVFASAWVAIPAAIAAVVLVVRALTDSWTDVWNIAKLLLPPLALLEPLFSAAGTAISWSGHMIAEAWGVLGDVTTILIGETRNLLKWMSDLGATVGPSFLFDIFGVTSAFKGLMEGLSVLHQAIRDSFPTYAKFEDWVGEKMTGATNRLYDAFKNGRQYIREWADEFELAIPKVKNLTETENRHWANKLAWSNAIASISKGQAFDPSQYTKVANDYLAATYGVLGGRSLLDGYGDPDVAAGKGKKGKGAPEPDVNPIGPFYGPDWFGPILQGRPIGSIPGTNTMPQLNLPAAGGGLGDFLPSWGVGQMAPMQKPSAGFIVPDPAKSSYDKFWKSAVDNASKIANEFDHLATITDGMLSKSVKQIGEFFAVMGIAGKSGLGLKQGWSQMLNGKDASEKMAGFVNLAQSGIAAYGSFMAATNHRNMGQNLLGGASTGAEIGSAFGPWGTAIGAGAGLILAAIKGRPEWAKLGTDIGRDLGVQLSDELLKAMEADSKKFGRQATESLHLADIIKEAGGLDSGNLEKFSKTLRDTFSMLDTGKISVQQATQVIDENFAAFAKASTDEYGFLSDQMHEIMTLSDQYGVRSKAIMAYLKEQAASFHENVLSTAAVFLTDTSEQAAQLQQTLDDVNSQIDELEQKKKSSGLSAAEEKQLGGLYDQRTNTSRQLNVASMAPTETNVRDMGEMIMGDLAAAQGTGMSRSAAIRQESELLTSLEESYKKLGIDIDTTGMKSIFMQNNIQKLAPTLTAGIDGLGKSMANLSNMNLESEDSFRRQERTGYDMYVRMQSVVASFGGSTKDALEPMQGYLHAAQEAAEKLHIPLDETTRMMIEQSKQEGIWEEKGKKAADPMINSLGHLDAVIQDLILTMKGIPTHFVTDWEVNQHINQDSSGGGDGSNPDGGGSSDTPSGPPASDAPSLPDVHYNEENPYMFAYGGFAPSARKAVVGERVPEVVLPIDRATPFFADAMKMAMQSGASGGGDTHIHFEGALIADGPSVERTLMKYFVDGIVHDQHGVRRVIRKVK